MGALICGRGANGKMDGGKGNRELLVSLGEHLVPKTISLRTGVDPELFYLYGIDFDQKRKSDPQVLPEFVSLADAPADEYLQFARRWGVLGLCHHGLPCSHNPPRYDGQGKLNDFCVPGRYRGEGTAVEPISTWRAYAKEARAILRIAEYLRVDQDPNEDDWKVVCERLGRVVPETATKEAQKQGAAQLLTEWLQLGGVRPTVEWIENGQPALLFSGIYVYGTLVGTLAMQLVSAVTDSRGLAICDSCGVAYAPSRRPSPTRRHYCQKCGIKAAWRDAAKDKRLRRQKSDK